ncbi:hypothetical protein BGX30_003370 [Mortierella sp. GBA39]|nr:hypothetical protein BGX30_003370 [Mortierella sp. GBA39]
MPLGLGTWQYKYDWGKEECYLWQPRPILTLALSLLALAETLITYRPDNVGPPPGTGAGTGTEASSSTTNRQPVGTYSVSTNASQPSPTPTSRHPQPSSSALPVQVSSTPPPTVLHSACSGTSEHSQPSRGTICNAAIIGMVSHDEYDLFGRFPKQFYHGRSPRLGFCMQPLGLSSSMTCFNPPPLGSHTTFARNLGSFSPFFPGCLLALWTVVETIRAMMDKVAMAGDRCWNPRLGYTISGALFGSLMAVEAVMTFLFDRRRYNTARKVNAFQEQQDLRRQEKQQQLQLEQSDEDTAAAGIELGGSDGKFQESGLFEGKISLDTHR